MTANRSFVPIDFVPENWDAIKPFYQSLLQREFGDKSSFIQWLKDRSELESILSEDAAWRYIKMTCDTTNKEYIDQYTYFVNEIEPRIAPFNHELNEKIVQSPLKTEFDEQAYHILFRSIEKDFKIFREKNIPLKTEIQNLSKEFGVISGAMTVTIDGTEMTLQQASVILQQPDRLKREEVYRKIAERRFEDRNKLDELFTNLITLRHQLALNADFSDFRDYMFTALGRFDYSKEDCFAFHESVREAVVPMLTDISTARKNLLGLDDLRPWDKAVDPTGKPPLKPFGSGDELVEKTIECFSRLDPLLGKCIQTMREMKRLDLDSRIGKAPGGYNYPLAESGVPFIFMNSANTLRDLVTMMHEGGHAVHSFLTHDLALGDFKNTPSEVAELASMSMELISMDHWDIFFPDEEGLKRAKKEHLTQIIETLPWVAIIDKFQHWIYENPVHTTDRRYKSFMDIYQAFSDTITNWSGLEHFREVLWQRQLHLYEVPFYYIEYGFAQLGAIALWKKYRQNPAKGLEGYKNALRLGYTRNIPDIYRAAGIEFNFSRDYIGDLMQFVRKELEEL